jgi:hypothetical protein
VRHLDEVLQRLIPFGIPQYLWDLGSQAISYRYDDDVPDNRRILSLGDLEYGFVIWLVTFPIPIFVFICELLSFMAERVVRKFAGLIEFLMLLRAHIVKRIFGLIEFLRLFFKN